MRLALHSATCRGLGAIEPYRCYRRNMCLPSFLKVFGEFCDPDVPEHAGARTPMFKTHSGRLSGTPRRHREYMSSARTRSGCRSGASGFAQRRAILAQGPLLEDYGASADQRACRSSVRGAEHLYWRVASLCRNGLFANYKVHWQREDFVSSFRGVDAHRGMVQISMAVRRQSLCTGRQEA